MKRAHWVGLRLGCGLLVLLMACALVVFAFFYTFYPHVPSANYPTTHDLATAQRQDLNYFRRYFTLDRSYTPTARVQAEQLFRETDAKAGALSPAAFSLSILRMVAVNAAADSHTFLNSEGTS